MRHLAGFTSFHLDGFSGRAHVSAIDARNGRTHRQHIMPWLWCGRTNRALIMPWLRCACVRQQLIMLPWCFHRWSCACSQRKQCGPSVVGFLVASVDRACTWPGPPSTEPAPAHLHAVVGAAAAEGAAALAAGGDADHPHDAAAPYPRPIPLHMHFLMTKFLNGVFYLAAPDTREHHMWAMQQGMWCAHTSCCLLGHYHAPSELIVNLGITRCRHPARRSLYCARVWT